MNPLVQPPMREWKLRAGGAPADQAAQDRVALRELLKQNALRFGGASVGGADRLIATGHQAWLWHPGILAKDIAMAVAAERHDAGTFHLVVDQDVHEALALDVPIHEGRRLASRRIALAAENHALPSGCQPAADPRQIASALRSLQSEAPAADLRRFMETVEQLPACRSLAEQVGVWTARLMGPWTGPTPLLFATQLNLLPSFDPLVQRMLGDARACVAAYNRAVSRHPAARVASLAESLDRVELPLWALGWEQPRLKVFADLSDTRPALALESGEVIDLHGLPLARTRRGGLQLAPKALFMTALLRRSCCDLFIHGKGGGIYDAITEAWWRDWAGEEIAPMAVVSADVYLPFEVPVATRDELAKAVWWSHHVPHNMDRALSLHDGDTLRKRALLEQMNHDRNRARRAAAFAELHAINARLAAAYPAPLAEAAARLDDARMGVRNHGTASRRDWCFALYPNVQLGALRDAIAVLQ